MKTLMVHGHIWALINLRNNRGTKQAFYYLLEEMIKNKYFN